MSIISMYIDTHEANTTWAEPNAVASQAEFERMLMDEGVIWDSVEDIGGIVLYTADDVFVAWCDYENDWGYM